MCWGGECEKEVLRWVGDEREDELMTREFTVFRTSCSMKLKSHRLKPSLSTCLDLVQYSATTTLMEGFC
jgi:hypothetical protein